jgi:hypothetical protein
MGQNHPSSLVSEPAAPSGGSGRIDIVDLVSIACRSQRPILSVEELAAATRLTARSIERRCESAGVRARNVVAFALCVRAIAEMSIDDWNPELLFPDRDPRTAQRMCRIGGLCSSACPSLAEFISKQQFLPSAALKQRLEARLSML